MAYFNKLQSEGNSLNKLLWPGQVHNSMICRSVFKDAVDPAALIGKTIQQLFVSPVVK